MNTCLKCGKEFKTWASLGTHLWKTHAISSKEYYDAYIKKPEEGCCQVCGNPTVFRTLGQGYLSYCSRKCSAIAVAGDERKNKNKLNAIRSTVTKEYGVANVAKLTSVKEKRKATMLKVHGVEYYSQIEGFRDICHESNMKRYGVPSYAMLPEFKERMRKVTLERTGLPYNFSKNKDKVASEYNSFLEQHGCTLVDYKDNRHIAYRCNKCNAEMVEPDVFIRGRVGYGITPCIVCHSKAGPSPSSSSSLEEYIGSLGFDVTHEDYDIDGVHGTIIVVERRKLKIDYIDLYWHSEMFYSSKTHLDMSKKTEEDGYRLLHIFADEWDLKNDIVKSRIRSLLGIVSNKIYARRCTVKQLDASIASSFIAENHLQGDAKASIRYGLFFDTQLVAVMTFGRNRFSKNDIELIRYCTLMDTTVVGGAGKLFRHFVNEHSNVNRVVSYADSRWSSKDTMYTKIGFRLDGSSKPSYYYIVGGARVNRMAFMKCKLVDDGFDCTKSEHQIMMERGYYRVYDCGTLRFVWNRMSNEGTLNDNEPQRIISEREKSLIYYDNLVKPHGCRAIGLKYGKNVTIRCEHCGKDSVIYGPLIETRIACGIPICTLCAVESLK